MDERSTTPDEPFNYDELSPGVREIVRSMHQAGFTRTVDSGDGSNRAAGMTCALDHLHVVFQYDSRADADRDAERLHAWATGNPLIEFHFRVEINHVVGEKGAVVYFYDYEHAFETAYQPVDPSPPPVTG